MNIIGSATTMGERKRNVIPGWQRMKNGWRKITGNSKPQVNVPLSAGATFTAETALQIAQRNFVNAQSVSLGVNGIPTSVSFPDGKVHPGMDKL